MYSNIFTHQLKYNKCKISILTLCINCRECITMQRKNQKITKFMMVQYNNVDSHCICTICWWYSIYFLFPQIWHRVWLYIFVVNSDNVRLVNCLEYSWLRILIFIYILDGHYCFDFNIFRCILYLLTRSQCNIRLAIRSNASSSGRSCIKSWDESISLF